MWVCVEGGEGLHSSGVALDNVSPPILLGNRLGNHHPFLPTINSHTVSLYQYQYYHIMHIYNLFRVAGYIHCLLVQVRGGIWRRVIRPGKCQTACT